MESSVTTIMIHFLKGLISSQLSCNPGIVETTQPAKNAGAIIQMMLILMEQIGISTLKL
jgi:hypothetical protein